MYILPQGPIVSSSIKLFSLPICWLRKTYISEHFHFFHISQVRFKFLFLLYPGESMFLSSMQ